MLLSLTVNERHYVEEVETRLTLADFLRERLGLKGCKIACDAGVCGACVVLVDGLPLAACSTFAFDANERNVTTIEGLANGERLTPVQQALLSGGGFQCGFCTPGMILSLTALVARHDNPDERTVRDWLATNLCRCTGYRAILDAVQSAIESARAPASQ